ncbi:MAG TPA: GntR family transcriptional regulator [Trueperaceae bacterium]|nr:GntR family transcriptional regulator [Trueperaceae bacterium]
MTFAPAIDKALPTPAYLQLLEALREAIEEGSLRPGHALPSERELAQQLHLSRMTVRRAFEELGRTGLVEQRQGSGTYVRAHPLEQVLDRVLGFTDEARHLGLRPGARMLGAERIAADREVATALQLETGTTLLCITRLRTADEAPLAVQAAFLTPSLITLSLEALERSGSLYRCIAEQFGTRPARAHQSVGARLPSRQECALLEIARDVPVLDQERTTYGDDGRPFEFVRSAYRGDRYRMALDLRAGDA